MSDNSHTKINFYIVQGYVSTELLLHLFGIPSMKFSHDIFKWLNVYCIGCSLSVQLAGTTVK